MAKRKTYQTRIDGKPKRVTIPENEDEGEGVELYAIMRDNFSPQAIAAMASFLDTALGTVGTNDPDVDQQLHYFVNELINLLGGEKAHARLCEEIGL